MTPKILGTFSGLTYLRQYCEYELFVELLNHASANERVENSPQPFR